MAKPVTGSDSSTKSTPRRYSYLRIKSPWTSCGSKIHDQVSLSNSSNCLICLSSSKRLNRKQLNLKAKLIIENKRSEIKKKKRSRKRSRWEKRWLSSAGSASSNKNVNERSKSDSRKSSNAAPKHKLWWNSNSCSKLSSYSSRNFNR